MDDHMALAGINGAAKPDGALQGLMVEGIRDARLGDEAAIRHTMDMLGIATSLVPGGSVVSGGVGAAVKGWGETLDSGVENLEVASVRNGIRDLMATSVYDAMSPEQRAEFAPVAAGGGVEEDFVGSTGLVISKPGTGSYIAYERWLADNEPFQLVVDRVVNQSMAELEVPLLDRIK